MVGMFEAEDVSCAGAGVVVNEFIAKAARAITTVVKIEYIMILLDLSERLLI